MRAKRIDAMTVGPFSYVLAVQEAGAEALAIGVSTRKEPARLRPEHPPLVLQRDLGQEGQRHPPGRGPEGEELQLRRPGLGVGPPDPEDVPAQEQHQPRQGDAHRLRRAATRPRSWRCGTASRTRPPRPKTTLYNLRDKQADRVLRFPGQRGRQGPHKAEVEALFEQCPNGKIAMLAYSDPVPNTPFAIRGDLPARSKSAVKDALLSMKDDPEFVKKSKRWYLDPHKERGLPSLDAYYNPLRDVARMLELDLKTLD